MTQEEILEETEKCKENPYYFAKKYLTVKNHKGEKIPFNTPLSEQEFNRLFKEYETRRNKRL